jgi:catechol 2,3-dioxygenase-like lactoylglutathione lyase family enzyme
MLPTRDLSDARAAEFMRRPRRSWPRRFSGIDDGEERGRQMAVVRIVPDLKSESLATATAFYSRVLGLRVVMDHGWIVTLADPQRPEVQLSIMTHDATAPVVPIASIQVDDIDASYRAARAAGAEIVHELTEEAWGVRRFFVRDPDGHVVNVLGHD